MTFSLDIEPTANNADNEQQQHNSSTDLLSPAINGATNNSHIVDTQNSAQLRYPGLQQQSERVCLRDSSFSEEQVIRLILQELRDRGFVDTFENLQRESGYTLEESTVTQFRNFILAGKWTEVEQALSSIGIESEKDRNAALFIIKRQKFLELLEVRKLKQALLVLQNELSSLTDDISQLHRLSSLLMCPSPTELQSSANWDGSNGRSRFLVLESLQAYISPKQMVPAHRMETLFNQALKMQVLDCEYHIRKAEPNLYIDHACPELIFPHDLHTTLRGHTDEVWYVAFSPDGKYLASASKDKVCIIWSTEDYSIAHRLEGHTGEIPYLAWSPDSKCIVTASNDKTLKLWDVEDGELLHTFTGHKEAVTTCRWLIDGRFISGSLDKKIIIWDVRGNMVKQIGSPRVHDIAVSPDITMLFVADNEVNINVYDLTTMTFMYKLEEPSTIMSISLSSNSRYCLSGLVSGTLHLWDIATQTKIREFVGHTQGQCVIRSGFAGPDSSFVYSGSEDGNIFVWSTRTGRLLVTLKAHEKTINCCAWNPVLSTLASASDDYMITVWPSGNSPAVSGDIDSMTSTEAQSSNSIKLHKE